ncbi:hypothetical protein GLF_1814 [Gluconobacter frateurii NBRC 101659]|nr:hypothetical protein GLF_1814 [Gluconobacter frateurii NBRC 101659]
MIRIYPHENGIVDISPEAIFWRPLLWFCKEHKKSSDDLDEFNYVTYDIGNRLRFELRFYNGHPAGTTTFYLSREFGNSDDIQHAINRAIDELHLPKSAIAWRRGIEFQYGKLDRIAKDRLQEPEARLIALKLAARMPQYQASTDQLIEHATDLFTPSPLDNLPSRTRKLQPQWHQIIRNVISHRHLPNGIFAQEYAVRTNNGLSLTEKGLKYLENIGFI